MKTKLDIERVKGRLVLVDDISTLKKGDKVLNIAHGTFRKAESLGPSIGYNSGPAFLYFRETIHRRFVKFITKKDLEKLL